MRTKIRTSEAALVDDTIEKLQAELVEVEFELEQPNWMIGRGTLNKLRLHRLHLLKKLDRLVDNA